MSTTRSCSLDSTLTANPPSSVVLEAPSLSSSGLSICPQLGEDDAATRNLLLVSLSGNPDGRLDAWGRHGGLPQKVAVITADTSRQAVAAEGGSVSRGPDGTVVSTTTVSEPSDLTGIGIKMSKCLSAWADEDARTHVCFDSLTTLLQYADVEQVFQYLHVTNKRIEAVGGSVHYHIDPNAHDEQTLSTIESLFSDVFTYETESGTWSRT